MQIKMSLKTNLPKSPLTCTRKSESFDLWRSSPSSPHWAQRLAATEDCALETGKTVVVVVPAWTGSEGRERPDAWLSVCWNEVSLGITNRLQRE